MFPLLRLCHRRPRRPPVRPRDPFYSDSNSYDSFDDEDDDKESSVKEKCMPWLNKGNSKHKHKRKPRLSPEICLMCSYDGHFKNKGDFSSNQKYTGGENRLVTVSRHYSAEKLFRHLSTTIFGSDSPTSFSLKYNLSSSNSLVSVVTDEDLQHMIKAFDRIPTFNNPRYLRVFLIPNEISDHPDDQTDKNSTLPCKLPPPPLPLPPRVIGDPKLRMMCRTGGRFYFYPCHSSQPAYLGGVNRIVVMDRRPSSLAQLFCHLSCVLFNGEASFTVKYNSPSDGLNCLVSLSTDDDFQNMIDLYNFYSSSSPSHPFHLRLFFFPLETNEEAAPSESDSGVSSNSKEESEPVLCRAEVQVVPDPVCRFQMQQIQNSGDLSPLDPLKVQKIQQMARAGTLCIDQATGEIPLVSSKKISSNDNLRPSAGQATTEGDTNEAIIISEP